MGNYNSIESIDRLIEQLEREIDTFNNPGPELKGILEERRSKLKRLKELKVKHEKAQKQAEIDKKNRETLNKIKRGNDELDDAIEGLERMINSIDEKATLSSNPTSSYSSESRSSYGESRTVTPVLSYYPRYSYNDGESRNGGESNW